MSDFYSKSGVNIAAGDDFSTFASEICAQTAHNSPYVEVTDRAAGNFRGAKGWRLKDLPSDCWFDSAADGIGTKPIIIDAAGSHRYAAHNLVAMTAGDITRYGGMPLVFCNVLDVSSLGDPGTATWNAAVKLMHGLHEVADEQGFVLYRGETAELGPCVGSENSDATLKFNWAGCMFGVWREDMLITGESLEPGQIVMALQEQSCRSNGISAIRRALGMGFGVTWWNNPSQLAIDLIHQAALPSTLYDKFLTDINGWQQPEEGPLIEVHAIAHISGGGIVDKFGEDILFRHGLSAHLPELFPPNDVLRWVYEESGMEAEESYRTFSSGNGALVVIDENDATPFIDLAAEYGITAKACGYISHTEQPLLRIDSQYDNSKLLYNPKEK